MASLFARVSRILCVFAALFALTISSTRSFAAPFAAIVMDARSGETLWEKNADTRLHPASLTKMMTLYIAFQEIEAGRISLDTKVTVSKNAAAQPPSRLGLKAGQKIALRYLIRAAAVKSANDAASAIGDAIGGGEAAFAKRMTKTAKALGMKNTTFKNANGLTSEGHLSTARDMTILGRHLFYDFPQYYNIFSRRTADAGIATVNNTNSRFLDAYEGADGIKTGYTVAAGFNLTASAKRGDKRIIATVFGGSSTVNRNAKMAELMDMGFDLARKGVREKKPDAAPLPEGEDVAAAAPDDDLIAAAVDEAMSGIDVPGAEGGAAKTIRVSGEVIRSIRPKARPARGDTVAVAAAPEAEVDADPLADAIALGVATALAEATAPPPPEGTLEAQALDLTAEAAPAEEALAEADPAAAPPPPEGTLEAQAVALAEAPVEAPVAEVPVAEAPADTALAEVRPQPRPDAETAEEAPLVTAEATEAAPAEPPAETLAEAPAEPVLEEVEVAEAAPEAAPAEVAALEAPSEAAPAVTEVETVAADATAPAPDAEATRKAPIFETVAMDPAAPEKAEELVVVSKSTSGGRHWGVAVGAYESRYEAERALLKTGLAESATLNEGLRKITEKGGKYRASFLGLAEDQADLACRRLRARGMACETIGPG